MHASAQAQMHPLSAGSSDAPPARRSLREKPDYAAVGAERPPAGLRALRLGVGASQSGGGSCTPKPERARRTST